MQGKSNMGMDSYLNQSFNNKSLVSQKNKIKSEPVKAVTLSDQLSIVRKWWQEIDQGKGNLA